MSINHSKKERILEILKGTLDLESPLVTRSILLKIAEGRMPKLKGWITPWLLTLPVIVGGVIWMKTSGRAVEYPHSVAVMGGSLFALFLATWSISSSRLSRLERHNGYLKEALQELSGLKIYLVDYLRNLDKRTSRYFHCVTNSKVTSYFVLNQIIAALTERIENIEFMLKRPSHSNLKQAYASLQGTMVFTDGISANNGNVHVVPLAKLKQICIQLVEELDRGVKELEEEIRIAESDNQAMAASEE